jgi:hypothetical protein
LNRIGDKVRTRWMLYGENFTYALSVSLYK